VRPIADWGLRLLILRELLLDVSTRGYAWHLVTAVFMAPFIVLAPLNGAISNSLPKRWVLVGASAVSLLALTICCLLATPSLAWLAVVAACTAVYSPTRYALVPAAAEETHWSLARINAWIEMGGAAGIVVGLMTYELSDSRLLLIIASAISLLAALPVVFATDVRRPEPPLRSVIDFFGDAGRVLRTPDARLPVLVLAGFLGVLSAGSGVLIMSAFDAEAATWQISLLPRLIMITIGAAAGALLAGWQKHLHRGLGLVLLGAAGLLVAFAWASATTGGDDTAIAGMVPCILMGLMGGLVSVPLRAYYQAGLPPDARGNGMAVSNTFNYLATAGLAALLTLLVNRSVFVTLADQLRALMVLAILGTVVLIWVLKRPLLETACELGLWAVYRIRAAGPGLDQFPLQGPVIVLANHACWFDPLWIGKVVPRRVIPMMTSVFFDVPILRWLMVNVVRAIRVQASGFRREAPELQHAVAELDRGECLLIFPEGMMRRRDDQLLRQFGQGIWRILRDRPNTPVVACWIEGGWGSYFSYKNGLPTKNKRFDRWWPVVIGVDAPQVLDPKLLEDQRATRLWLMRACLGARRHIGLDVPLDFILEADGDG
jgi:1-acyl-sn-glycerol-3-phosphate acyltransferase/MFS family permease